MRKKFANDNDIYYIISTYEEYGTWDLARYNPEYDVFYDFKLQVDHFGEEELKDLEVGQQVCYEEHWWKPYNLEIDEEIVHKIKARKEKYRMLEEKYPDLGVEYKQIIPSTSEIIENYFKKKFDNKEKIDYYALGIVDMLAKAMDIRVRRRHGGNLYQQLGLDYSEEVEEAVDALYDIIKKKVAKLGKDDTLVLSLDMRYSEDPYILLIDELEMRTGFSFASKIKNLISSCEYHYSVVLDEDRLNKLINQVPTVYISKTCTMYDDNIKDSNSVKDLIDPSGCKEHYLEIFSESKPKVFVKQENGGRPQDN